MSPLRVYTPLANTHPVTMHVAALLVNVATVQLLLTLHLRIAIAHDHNYPHADAPNYALGSMPVATLAHKRRAVYGTAGSNSCPGGHIHITTESACRAAAHEDTFLAYQGSTSTTGQY